MITKNNTTPSLDPYIHRINRSIRECHKRIRIASRIIAADQEGVDEAQREVQAAYRKLAEELRAVADDLEY